MAKDLLENGPSEGELVVALVREVKQNGAYVDLEEYEGIEGFIFIGEIASGWVKNIRSIVREGQRVVAKVIKVKKDKFGDWEANKFAPEEAFLQAAKGVAGVTGVETQNFTFDVL